MPKAFVPSRRWGYVALAGALLLPIQAEAHGGGAAAVLVRLILEIAADTLRHGAPVPGGPAPAPVPVLIPVSPSPPGPPTEIPLAQDRNPSQLRGQDLLHVTPMTPSPLLVRDFTRSFYTLVGGSAAEATGLMQQDGIEDPAPSVSAGLVGVLTSQFGMRDAGAVASVDAPPAAVPGYVLEVITTHWELKSVSINPLHIVYGMRHYGIYYHAKFRLLSRKDGSVMSMGYCDESPAVKGAPTYDQSLADGGKLIKDMLRTAASGCVSDIGGQYFHIPKPLAAD